MRDGGGLTLRQTSAGHMPIGGPNGTPVARFTSEASPDSETTLDGNAVVVEEQMLKMAESRMAYDAAIGLYQKSMSMLRLAAKPPGR
jgi:flagellar basal-body rod protein FlgB